MRAAHCQRGRCRRKGAKLFEAAIPIAVFYESSEWGQVFGGGGAHVHIRLCARHEDRIRRFTRWALRPV
jgi:hypothetical protein